MRIFFTFLSLILLSNNMKATTSEKLYSLDLIGNNQQDVKIKFPNCADAPLDFKNCTKSRCYDISQMGIVYREIEGSSGEKCLYKEQLTHIGGIECKLPKESIEDFAAIIENQYNKDYKFVLHGEKNPIITYCIHTNLDRSYQLINLETAPSKIIYDNEKLIIKPQHHFHPNITDEKAKIFYISPKNWSIVLNGKSYGIENQPNNIKVLEVNSNNVVLGYPIKNLEDSYPSWQSKFVEQSGDLFVHKTENAIKLNITGKGGIILLTMQPMQYFDARDLSIKSLFKQIPGSN
jgi:hypothetical protein